MKKLIKIIFFLGIFIFLVGALNYSGFCFKELRFMSDEEKVRVAVNFMIKDRWERMRKKNPYLDRENDWFWKDADHFLAENPGCCQVAKKFYSCGFFHCLNTSTLPSILGWYSDEVYIEFVSPRAEQLRDDSYYKSKTSIRITSCGSAKYLDL